MMNRNDEFYIKYTNVLSQYSYKNRIDYLNDLLISQYMKKKDEFLTQLKETHSSFNIEECAKIFNILTLLNFSKNEIDISFYNILLDSATNIEERKGIIKREGIILSFLFNVERHWYSMGYNSEFLNLLVQKSEFIMSLKKARIESKEIEPLIKRNIKLIEFNNKMFDIDNYMEAFIELAKYSGNGIQNMMVEEFEEAQKALKDIIVFKEKVNKHLKSIYMEDKKDIFLNTLINNKNSLYYLYHSNYFNIQNLVNLDNQKEKSLLLDYMNGYELHQFVNNPHESEIEDNIKDKTSELTYVNFIQGGKKNKDHTFYKRDHSAYTSLEKLSHDNFTNALVQFCSKRDNYIEYYKNRFFRSYTRIDKYKFKINEIEYSKVDQIISFKKTKDFTPYSNKIYEQNHSFTNEVEYNTNSVLLKLNLNLPRNELEYFINDFLDEYHKINLEIPKTIKSRTKKIKKIVDILFIYDGKQLNISNSDIINELQKYNETIDPLHAGETSPATFQRYKKIGINLIDNKEYLKVASGEMSVFDILNLDKAN